MKALWVLFILFFATFTAAQKPPTIGEVFNHEVGYEFHSKGNVSGPPHATRLTVIDKQWSQTRDTVFYTMIDSGYSSSYYEEPEPHNKYFFYIDTVYKFYTNLNSSIYSLDLGARLPKEPSEIGYFNDSYSWDPDSIDSNITHMVDTFHTEPWNGCGSKIFGFDLVSGSLYFEPSEYGITYALGAGQISYHKFWGGGNSGVSGSVFYYKLDSIECGIPDRTTSINIPVEPVRKKSLSIYPNPCHNRVHVNFEGTPNGSRVSIYSTTGNLILQVKDITSIDTSLLRVGTYLIKTELQNIVYTALLVKE